MHGHQRRPATRPFFSANATQTIFASILLIIITLLAFTSSPAGREASAAVQYDIIIRGGRVVDGTGRAGFAADVAIKGDRVAFVGRLPREAKARREIDARGLIVAPGFIDMLGQSEQNVLIDPRAMSKVMMGVTTEVTGEGSSIAPINERLIKEDEDFYRRYNLTVDWRTLDQYFSRLGRQGAGINLATFVGATQVRAYVVGFDNRAPNEAELEKMKALVAEAMEQGALGVSTALQYVPARFAKTDE
ncbi:MAG: dihydroorotase, partial [Acidobacteria bacterium]